MLKKKLSDLEKVTKSLQRKDAKIRNERVYFDNVLVSYPELPDRLDSDARVVRNQLFEGEMLKIQKHQKGLMDGK